MDERIERLLTVEDVATCLGLAPQTIRNWVAMRKMPFLRIGRRTKFLRKSIEAWMEQQEKRPLGINF